MTIETIVTLKSNSEELAVIEYQMQQIRLFPYLAASFIHHHFSRNFFENFHEFLMAGMVKENPEQIALMGQEIHGISSSGKERIFMRSQ